MTEDAKQVTVILIHGRGGTREEMMAFAIEHLPPANFLAMQAPAKAWYPHSFLVPRERNEPYLSQSLQAVTDAIRESGAQREKIVLLGFSQGACLALEYVARNPGKYSGVLAFSGGLIGEELKPVTDSLNGTPIILTCSEEDPHIPLFRVKASAALLHEASAEVQLYSYPGDTHTITEHELQLAAELINRAQ